MGRKEKTAYARTAFIKMSEDIDVFDLADKLMLRQPLIVNFETYDLVESNRVIVFLSGVIYALDGEVEVLRERIFAFATKPDMKDKTLREFIARYKE
ncbi:MAG: cell division protein SepF [Acholeplasmatales bacterium]|nr:MAG: cell division protein SepF [Acholeplasmatales bacterium]